MGIKIENDIGGWKSIAFVVGMLFVYGYNLVNGLDLVIYYPLYYEDIRVIAMMYFSMALLWSCILDVYIAKIKDAATKAELLAALMDASNTIGLCLDIPGPKTPAVFEAHDRFVRNQLEDINKVIVKHAYKRKKKNEAADDK